jgi:hypothetical protein
MGIVHRLNQLIFSKVMGCRSQVKGLPTQENRVRSIMKHRFKLFQITGGRQQLHIMAHKVPKKSKSLKTEYEPKSPILQFPYSWILKRHSLGKAF